MAVTFDDLKKRAKEYHSWMVDIRRHLHRNPEVSYQEYETTRFIEQQLTRLGIRVERPLETGCIGILEGKQVREPGRQVIALRADIDALAMQEEGEHKEGFLSERPGIAHCCGHDAHTANLLGAARIVADFADRLQRTVVFIFQPGEEMLPGGGRLLTETGILQELGVQEIYGLHTNPMHPPGTIAVKSGPMMARPDEFEAELVGKGGHAAAPHMAVDPVVMAAGAVTAFQTIVSRNLDPTEPAVITVGKIEGGSTYNVIPEKALLKGTVRTFSKETAFRIRDRMEQVLDGVARTAGGSYRFRFNEGYPAVDNDPLLTEKLRKTASALLGEERVIRLERPVMAGEDFAFYQQVIPGVFFFLGSGSPETGSDWSWHHPKYNVDESSFLTGAPLMAALALGSVV